MLAAVAWKPGAPAVHATAIESPTRAATVP